MGPVGSHVAHGAGERPAAAGTRQPGRCGRGAASVVGDPIAAMGGAHAALAQRCSPGRACLHPRSGSARLGNLFGSGADAPGVGRVCRRVTRQTRRYRARPSVDRHATGRRPVARAGHLAAVSDRARSCGKSAESGCSGRRGAGSDTHRDPFGCRRAPRGCSAERAHASAGGGPLRTVGRPPRRAPPRPRRRRGDQGRVAFAPRRHATRSGEVLRSFARWAQVRLPRSRS